MPNKSKIIRDKITRIGNGNVLILISLWLSACGIGFGQSNFERLPRTNLLVYHTADGAIAGVKSKRDWEKRRPEILKACQQVMGPLPGKEKRCALDVQVESEKYQGRYLERLITYASEPHSRVPAYLLIPKEALRSKRKFPAILALHPTEMQHGHRVVVEQMQQNYRAYGRDLG